MALRQRALEGLAVSASPLVSIGVPIFNGDRYVRAALEGIAAQTFQDYEVVVVDNGSNDGTAEICKGYAAADPRIRYIRYESTIPVVDNFCRAANLARGTYFCWWAADDQRPPKAIERAVEVFRRHSDTVMVHGAVEVNLALEGRMMVVANDFVGDEPDPARRVAAVARHLQHNAMLYGLYRRDMMSRAVFRQHRGQDTLFCIQMALIGPIRWMPDVMIRYRHVTANTDSLFGRPHVISLRGLVAWPTNRFKCLLVLYYGCRYLLRESGSSLITRLRATTAFVRAFTTRFGRHLIAEIAFVISAPVAVVLRPLMLVLKKINPLWSTETAVTR